MGYDSINYTPPSYKQLYGVNESRVCKKCGKKGKTYNVPKRLYNGTIIPMCSDCTLSLEMSFNREPY